MIHTRFSLSGPLMPTARWLVILILVLPLTARFAAAQDIEPRRWSHLPIGANFAGAAYAHTTGDVYLDPGLQLQDVEFDLETFAVKYIRSFEALGKSARVDLTQPYQSGHWTGLINGVPASTDREGLADTTVRVAVNLLGAPPLAGKEFARYRAQSNNETIVGAGLVVQLPTGKYYEDKLINLGGNRFTFRPQIGAVHSWDKWSAELTAATVFFTDNDEFFNGRRLEQDPVYTADANLVYTFRPGLWLASSLGYAGGGNTTVNGASSDNSQSSIGWGLSLGVPITQAIGAKVGYVGTRTQVGTGMDTDTFACAISVLW
ncbi:MAG: transporter [Opitutaceae bacterium]|nr:transporter [Opitutaceae bacterium]